MNLPQAFVERTRRLLGEEYPLFEASLHQDTPVSIRPNRGKYLQPIDGEPIPWASSGVYLKTRPTFTFDPLFHAGCYYVQEASSMFVERVLSHYVKEPVTMLDLCAAPGGKSTLCRSALPEGSLLVANEVMRNRSQILAENLIKWGHPDVIVTNNDPADFTSLTNLFDVVLTDVPCSGEGMFRKDEEARESPTITDELSYGGIFESAEVARRCVEASVSLRLGAPDELGGESVSGVIVSEDGWILSGAPAFKGERGRIYARLCNGRDVPVEEVRYDGEGRMTLYRICEEGLTVAELSDGSAIPEGTELIAISSCGAKPPLLASPARFSRE